MLQFSKPKLFILSSPILTFDSRKLGTPRTIKLAEEIGKQGAIKILMLGNNEINDDAIPAIVQHLILNPKISLEVLELGGNNITNVGAEQLILALKQRNTLTSLFLNGNTGISYHYLKEITTLMAENKNANRKKQGM
jgi:Ran GTPase-activating protein (RanGAP) involved in mRNA processing and transport